VVVVGIQKHLLAKGLRKRLKRELESRRPAGERGQERSDEFEFRQWVPCLGESLCVERFEPAAKHAPDFQQLFLRLEDFRLVDDFQFEKKAQFEKGDFLATKEVASWMRGFEHRFEEANVAMHTKTFSEWLSYKADIFISQSPEQDREKLTAIFDHFGILDPEPKIYDKKPMTHLEIGYLSPRVPRPLIVEEKAKSEHPVEGLETAPEFRDRDIESVEYLTTAGERVRVVKKETSYQTTFGDNSVVLVPDQSIRFFDDRDTWQEGVFVGLTKDTDAIAVRVGGLVYVSDKESFEKKMEKGTATEFSEMLGKDVEGFYKEGLEDECGVGYLVDDVVSMAT
jgi:hypothetical protein